jgi:putative transposase
LREAEVQLSQAKTAADTCHSLNVSEQTYFRWRKEYGSMGTDQAYRFKELEKENTRLKRLVADLSPDTLS